MSLVTSLCDPMSPTASQAPATAASMSSNRLRTKPKGALRRSQHFPLQDMQQPRSLPSTSFGPTHIGTPESRSSKKVYKARQTTPLSPVGASPVASSSRAAASVSSTPSRKARSASPAVARHHVFESDKVNISIPQRLPKPPLQIVSDPRKDLAAHLRFHNLKADAAAVEGSGMPGEFLLDAYLEAGQLGKCSLYQQTADFVPRLKHRIRAQVHDDDRLPRSLTLDVSVDGCGSHLPPTHVLAVYSDNEEATLVAAHDMVLALQCTSIPVLPPSVRGDKLSSTSLPVVPLCVPHPALFSTVHKWLYSPDSTCVYQDLIPMAFVVRFLSTLSRMTPAGDDCTSSSAPEAASSRSSSPASAATATAAAAEQHDLEATTRVSLALSHLATKTLLEMLKRIQGVWKNGAAVGITSPRFWNQLDKAWEAVVGALVEGKRRKAASRSVQDVVESLGCASL